MLFLTNTLDYITQTNNEIIKSFYAQAVLLMLLLWHCVNDGTCRIDKKTYSRSRRISLFDGLHFDCATSSNTFNCTNIFFHPYLPIHHTTFMSLRFVLRPFSLSIPNARSPQVEIFLSSKKMIVFDFVLQKSG